MTITCQWTRKSKYLLLLSALLRWKTGSPRIRFWETCYDRTALWDHPAQIPSEIHCHPTSIWRQPRLGQKSTWNALEYFISCSLHEGRRSVMQYFLLIFKSSFFALWHPSVISCGKTPIYDIGKHHVNYLNWNWNLKKIHDSLYNHQHSKLLFLLTIWGTPLRYITCTYVNVMINHCIYALTCFFAHLITSCSIQFIVKLFCLVFLYV